MNKVKLTGWELRMKRLTLDITGAELSRHLEISKSYICRMERGSRDIPESKYMEWSSYLNQMENSRVHHLSL